jgi:hypothetical protein
MARPQAVFLASVFAMSALFIVSLLAVAGVDASPTRVDLAGGPVLSAPMSGNPLSSVAIVPAAPPVTCTLVTTTTDELESSGTFNDNFASAATLANYMALALAPGNRGVQIPTKDDFFAVNAQQGLQYPAEAKPNQVGNYNFGIIVYNASQTPILTDTNTLDGSSARITLIAPSTGVFYFRIFQVPGTSCNGGTYTLTASEATPTPTLTPTSGPTSTPTPVSTVLAGADRFEPNFSFDNAGLLALNVKYTDLSFVPWAGADPYSRDDDWFKVWVKPGLLVTCETLDLAAGVDTNLILFDNNRNTIGGNDDKDRANGDFGSRLSYYVTYEGYLFLDVGQPFAPLPTEVTAFKYAVQCVTGTGPTFTPSATRPPQPTVPTNTPVPPTPTIPPTDTPAPTSTPPFIQVRQLPTATPAGEAKVLVPINLQVYYDANNNRQPDPGEGVVGVSARVTDVNTGQELQRSFTDEFGFASLTVSASGVVRLSVPYLNYSVIVQPSGSSIALRIAPHDLPKSIP